VAGEDDAGEVELALGDDGYRLSHR
jgi:hypothetical protein